MKHGLIFLSVILIIGLSFIYPLYIFKSATVNHWEYGKTKGRYFSIRYNPVSYSPINFIFSMQLHALGYITGAEIESTAGGSESELIFHYYESLAQKNSAQQLDSSEPASPAR